MPSQEVPCRQTKPCRHATKLVGVDVGCLNHQIPGGMLSNLESQLKTMNMSDRLPKVLKEVIQVRADMAIRPLQRRRVRSAAPRQRSTFSQESATA